MVNEVRRGFARCGGLDVKQRTRSASSVLACSKATVKTLIFFFLALLAAEPGSAQAAQDSEIQVAGPIDFRQIVVRAKDRVFPSGFLELALLPGQRANTPYRFYY